MHCSSLSGRTAAKVRSVAWPAACRTLRVAVCAIVLLGAMATHARADRAQDRQAASVLVKKGVELLRAGDYEAALPLFRSAYKTYPSAKILVNIGTTLRALKRHAEAANTYQDYLDTLHPTLKEEVTQQLTELDRLVCRLRITTDRNVGTVVVQGREYRAKRGPLLVRVSPGDRTVTWQVDRQQRVEARVRATAGAELEVALRSAPDTAAEPQPPRGAAAAEQAEASARPTRLPPVSTSSASGVSARSHLEPGSAGPFGAVAFANLDAEFGGAAAFIGGTADVGNYVVLVLAALLTPKSTGSYAGVRVGWPIGRWRPSLGAGVPVFFSDGLRPAIRGGGALSVRLTRRIEVSAEVNVERYLRREFAFEPTAIVPAVGTYVRF